MMCKCFDHNQKIHNEEHPDQAFPQVLLALIRLETNALNNFNSVEDDCQQVEEMRNILAKLSLTHLDSDNYANYLFKRAEQLSSHLETYQTIICKIEIGSEIESSFSQISKQFIEYLEKKLQFRTLWIESLEIIELSKQTLEEKLLSLCKLRSVAQDAYETKNYFELCDIKAQCDKELGEMNELMESCLNYGKRCKQFGSNLYDQLNELEVCFQKVVKMSMNRINEMKRTPASVSCDNVDW